MVCRRPAAAPWWYCCRRIQQNRDRLFAGIVESINTYAVIGVSIFRDLEHIGRSAVVKFHGQRIRREDVVGDVTAPLSGDVFICHCIGAACRTDRRQNCNRRDCKVLVLHSGECCSITVRSIPRKPMQPTAQRKRSPLMPWLV